MFEHYFGLGVLDKAPADLSDSEAIAALRADDPEITTADLVYELACRRYAADGDWGLLAAYFGAEDLPEGYPIKATMIRRGRLAVEHLREARWRSEHLCLEVAPAHVPDRAAAVVLAKLFEFPADSDEIAEKLAERRFAMTGDYRAIQEYESQQQADREWAATAFWHG